MCFLGGGRPGLGLLEEERGGAEGGRAGLEGGLGRSVRLLLRAHGLPGAAAGDEAEVLDVHVRARELDGVVRVAEPARVGLGDVRADALVEGRAEYRAPRAVVGAVMVPAWNPNRFKIPLT